ncbi:MAG: FecR domain-containing protein [Burkholderiales bacterium]|nr:FecR domain-containing protein [Burkholderiales bacterium]
MPQSVNRQHQLPTRAFLAWSLCALALALHAGHASGDAGTVEQLAGTLSVKGADGKIRILSRQSVVRQGDTINTERDSYAQIKLADGGRVTLKPNTTVRLDRFTFAQDKPKEDSFVYSLLRGGLRAVTGLLGQRSKDAYELKTETATVGIRGTTFSVDDCVTDRTSPDCARLNPAVYVGVTDGEIVVRNAQGELGIAAGQFGLIEREKRPLFLSTDPGLQFAPPASFIASLAGGSTLNTGRAMECVVGQR